MCIAEVCEVSLRQQHLDPDVFNGSIVMSLPFIGQRYQLFIQTSLLLPEYFAYEILCVRPCVCTCSFRCRPDGGWIGYSNQFDAIITHQIQCEKLFHSVWIFRGRCCLGLRDKIHVEKKSETCEQQQARVESQTVAPKIR